MVFIVTEKTVKLVKVPVSLESNKVLEPPSELGFFFTHPRILCRELFRLL